MMKLLLSALLFAISFSLQAEELKIKAENFEADEQKGYTVFTGNVKITKGSDEFNASKVTIYVDADRKPTKFIAIGDVSFHVTTMTDDIYQGEAQEVHFFPQKKEYRFYTNVHIKQLNKQKEINGDEVTVDLTGGKAFAKGGEKKPVIMIFNIDDANASHD